MSREPIITGNNSDKSAGPRSERAGKEGVEASIVSPPGQEDENRLRPTRLQQIVGQREVIARMEIAIQAALQRGESLGHILFDGPPGLGKTTFATCIPRELGVPIEFLSGPGLTKPKDVIPSLSNLQRGQVLFIDEIHRMSKSVEEFLYTAMEDFRIDVVMGEGVNGRTYSMKLQPFTMIGATTRAGMLSGPLRDRFLHREHLGFYRLEELTEIVRRNAGKLQIDINDESAIEIARRSRGTPRVANNRLRWIRDFAQTRADGRITLPVTMDALQMAEIDNLGLDGQDRKYLGTLIRVCGGGPTGIDTIAATMNASSDTLADDVEPFLLRSELILRTPRGRVATAGAYAHLKLGMPPAAVEQAEFPYTSDP
jgi:Holliday junction DNA helicase RuvB